MKFRIWFAGAVWLSTLVGCSTVASGIKARTIVSRPDKMIGYRTYMWRGGASGINDPKGLWGPVGFDMDAQMRRLIDQELRVRGFELNDQKPEAMVSYKIGVDMDAREETLRRIFGEDADLSNRTAGAMTITFADAKTGHTLWSGAAVAQILKRRDDERAKARLAAVVKKIFWGFPR